MQADNISMYNGIHISDVSLLDKAKEDELWAVLYADGRSHFCYADRSMFKSGMCPSEVMTFSKNGEVLGYAILEHLEVRGMPKDKMVKNCHLLFPRKNARYAVKCVELGTAWVMQASVLDTLLVTVFPRWFRHIKRIMEKCKYKYLGTATDIFLSTDDTMIVYGMSKAGYFKNK